MQDDFGSVVLILGRALRNPNGFNAAFAHYVLRLAQRKFLVGKYLPPDLFRRHVVTIENRPHVVKKFLRNVAKYLIARGRKVCYTTNRNRKTPETKGVL